MPRASADMDLLLAEAIRAAVHGLRERAEFFPFALALVADGQVRHIQGGTGEEQPDAAELITVAEQSLCELAATGRVRATALVSDVRIRRPETGESSDAIRVQLEHARGQPITCYLPYSLEAGQVVRGELFAESGTAAVFPARGSA
jgi:hypothetical protein